MPSFEIIQHVEYYLRKGKYRSSATERVKRQVRTAKAGFLYEDGQLLRKYKGRYLRAVSSLDQVREIMRQFHDDNNHAGRMQMVIEIMSVYYWERVRDYAKEWIQKCEVCKARKEHQAPEIVKSCLAYGCDASSFLHPDLTFHRFPKPSEQRQQWLVVAQRDEGSLRRNSWLCSRHFDPDCFSLTEDGQKVLRSDAVPTIIGASKQTEPSDPEEPLFQASSLEGLLTCAAASAEVGFSAGQSQSDLPPHAEHQYSLRVPDPQPPDAAGLLKSLKNTSFITYSHIARYLTHRVLPRSTGHQKKNVQRMSKRFSMIDGVLMYQLHSRLVRVPRSREEVNSILQQFHDNRGHYGHRTCFTAMAKHYYWGSMSKDLHHWISRCSTCLTRTKKKWFRCSITDCTNCCGPVERKLGLTFHKFPMNRPSLLERWVKAAGRPHWYPPLWSSVCSVHFTDDCFDRTGGKVELRPDAVPTVKTHGDEAIQSVSQGQTDGEAQDTEEQKEAFFSKADAAELFLSSQTYPPGLNGVERNTFRRFCKSYLLKDGTLCIQRSDRVVPVLRNRTQINEALKEYHDELNHLDFKKCLRLLNERCFWKTMRSDIRKWISVCAVCQWKNKLKNQPKQDERDKQRNTHSDPEGEMDIGDEKSGGSDVESESQRAVKTIEPPVQTQTVQKRVHNQSQLQSRTTNQTSVQTQVKAKLKTKVQPKQAQPQVQVLSRVQPPAPAQPPVQTKIIILSLNRQPGVPIALGSLSKPAAVIVQPAGGSTTLPPSALTPARAGAQPGAHMILTSAPLNRPCEGPAVLTSPPDPGLGSDKPQQKKNAKGTPKQRGKKQKTEMQIKNPNEMNKQHEEIQGVEEIEASTSSIGKTRVKQTAQSPTAKTQLPTHSSRGRPLKKRAFPAEETLTTKRVQSPVAEPDPAFSSKALAVITADVSETQTEQLRENRKTDSAPPVVAVRPLEARVLVQQCSRAKVKTRAGVDGAEPQYAQIGEGLVVYVCFFEGATEDTTHRIADAVMNTQFFLGSGSRRLVSVLELCGGLLLLPQESLGWERGPDRSIRSRGVIKVWRGSQLFSRLVFHCRETLLQSGVTGCAVEQGVYGQRQEIELTSSEPMSHLLEF